MSRLDRLDPGTKLYLSCALIALLATALAWWLLAQAGHAHQLANRALRPGAAAESAQGLRAHYSHVLLIGWVGIGVVAIAAALLGRWLAAELTRPLVDAAAVAARVAGGDLSSYVHSGGNGADGLLGRALQEMNDKLAAMVGQVRGGAEELVKGAGTIAAHNAKLGTQAERQLAALRQAEGSIGQMSEALRLCARQAVDAGELALCGRDAAAGAAVLAEQLCAAITTSRDAGARLAGMARTFDDIAFQTNMLALSCAVEAAQVRDQQEHGGGMSMVAFEARLLAQRTGEAARELRDVHEQALAGVHVETELAGRAHTALLDVAGNAQRVAQQVAEVAGASARHDALLDGAALSLSSLERASEDATAVSAQTAASAAALRDRAGSLVRLLGMFRLTRRPLRSGGHMYLAASNPDLIVRPARERRGRVSIAAVKS